MKRGEVWWAELPEEAGFRPVVIVSRAIDLDRRTSVTVAEITRRVRRLRSEVALSVRDGMNIECAINTDNLYTVSVARLRERMTALSDERMFELTNALKYSLDLDW